MSVFVFYNIGNFDGYCFVSISGHSGFDSRGSDIVCAGISAVVNGAMNYFSVHYGEVCRIKQYDSTVEIEVLKKTLEVQNCLELMIYQLLNISRKYPKHLKLCSDFSVLGKKGI